MTDAERLLWLRIRRKQLKGYQFYRQRPVGDYVVDFSCPLAKLVVELDGGQHFEEEGMNRDRRRDQELSDFGFRVLRFPWTDVFENLDGVVLEISEHLPEESP
jgi:very-short-patch-repair endonuclease